MGDSDVDLERWNLVLADASAEKILQWAWTTFPDRVAASSSFQTQSVPLLHLIAQNTPLLPVLFIDTGFHFPETLAFRDLLQQRLKLHIVPVRPNKMVKYDAIGRRLYSSDPDLCCYHHKVAPLNKVLTQFDALISGVRGDQTEHRAQMRVVERERSGTLRIHPFLGWTKREVWSYIDAHDLPAHPLFHEGYLSVGCKPCTRPVHAGEDERAGRWAGHQKTECGLHTQLLEPGKE